MTNLNSLLHSELTSSQRQLRDNCRTIAEEINLGKYDNRNIEEYSEPCADEYCANFLDINYIINQDKSYKSAIILVACGGPNIYIHTGEKEVRGYWGGDEYVAYYGEDSLGIDEYCEEVFNNS